MPPGHSRAASCLPDRGIGNASKKTRAPTSLEELARVADALGELARPELTGDVRVEAVALATGAREKAWRGGPRPKWKAAPSKSECKHQSKVLRSNAPVIKARGRAIRESP